MTKEALFVQVIFFNLIHTSDSTPSEHAKPESIAPIPFDAIIPFINDLRKDEDYDRGEELDKLDSQLCEKEAQLRRRLNRCSKPLLRQELEAELAQAIHERCKISQQFDEPYEPWME